MSRLLFVFLFFCSCNGQKKFTDGPHILIETGYGDVELVLYETKAPKTVAAFLANTAAGLYTGASFYRVIKNEDLEPEYNSGLIQGGIHHTTKQSQPPPFIQHESPGQTGLSHTDGTISMARTTVGSASSEFFICIGDQTQFDSSRRTNPDGQGYAAFGKVVKGMDVVRKIQSRPSDGDLFKNAIEIKRIKKL